MTEEIEQGAAVRPEGGATAAGPRNVDLAVPGADSPIERPNPSALVESRALWAGGASGLFGLLVGLVVFWGRDVPLFDREVSIGVVAIVCSFVATAASFGWSQYALWTARGRIPAGGALAMFRRVLAGLGLMLTHLAITLFAVLGVFALLALCSGG